jgi:hypothetical protein
MKNQKSEPGTAMEVSTSTKGHAKLGRDIQAKIGQQLRAQYEDVLHQGVPDRFVELLNRLDDKNKEEG